MKKCFLKLLAESMRDAHGFGHFFRPVLRIDPVALPLDQSANPGPGDGSLGRGCKGKNSPCLK
jgi:hypothetical protein